MKDRCGRIDCAKGVLIYLVVLGHLIEQVKGWDTRFLKTVYIAIYGFHIPAFVFFAGATSEVFEIKKRLIRLLAIFLVLNLLYSVPILIKSRAWPNHLMQPYWILWFIMSMIWWQALLRLCTKYKICFLVATLAALLVGVFEINGYIISFSRTIVFYPFFLAGYKSKHWVKNMSNVQRFGGVLFLILLVANSIIMFNLRVPIALLYGSHSFSQVGLNIWSGIGLRLIVLLGAAILILSFVPALSPQPSILLRTGQSSLCIYLLHGFFVKILGGYFALIYDKLGGGLGGLSLVVGAVCIVALLSMGIFRFIVEHCIRPVEKLLHLIFSDKAQQN